MTTGTSDGTEGTSAEGSTAGRSVHRSHGRLVAWVRGLFEAVHGHEDSLLRKALRNAEVFLAGLRYGRSGVEVQGWRLEWHPTVWYMIRKWAMGRYEPHVLDRFSAHVEPGMHIVDVGANFGIYSLVASGQLEGDGQVWAFEPNPTVYEILARNVEENELSDVVETVRRAVSDEDGEQIYQVDPRLSGTGEIQSGDNSRARFYEEHRVETVRLDTYFAEQGWPEADLVKMDVEGHEFAVLDGMRELSKRNPQMELVLEYGLDHLERAGVEPADLIARLKDLGFDSFEIVDFEEPVMLDLPDDLDELASLVAGRGSLMIWCRKGDTEP